MAQLWALCVQLGAQDGVAEQPDFAGGRHPRLADRTAPRIAGALVRLGSPGGGRGRSQDEGGEQPAAGPSG